MNINRFLSLALAAILLSLLVCSCGIPQEQYDEVLAGIEQAQAELAAANDSYSAVSSSLADVSVNLTAIGQKFSDLSQKIQEARQTSVELSASRNATEAAITEQDTLIASAREENTALKQRIPNLEYKTFESDSTYFTMDYPKDWKPNIDLQSFDSGMVIFMEDAMSDAGCLVVYGPEDDSISLDTFFASFAENLASSDQSGYLMSESRETIGERDAVSGMVILEDPTLFEKLAYQLVCIKDHRTYYVLAFFCLWHDYISYSFIFNEMLASVSFD